MPQFVIVVDKTGQWFKLLNEQGKELMTSIIYPNRKSLMKDLNQVRYIAEKAEIKIFNRGK